MWRQNLFNWTASVSLVQQGCLTFDPANGLLTKGKQATQCFVPGCSKNLFHQVLVFRPHLTSVLTESPTCRASEPSQMQAPSRGLTQKGVPHHRVKARKEQLDAGWNRQCLLKRFLWQHTSMWITAWRKHTVSSTTTRGLLSSLPRCHGQRLQVSGEITVTHIHKMFQKPDRKQVSLQTKPVSYWKGQNDNIVLFSLLLCQWHMTVVKTSFFFKGNSFFFPLQAIIAINPLQNGTQWQPKDWMNVVFYECNLVSFVYMDGQY